MTIAVILSIALGFILALLKSAWSSKKDLQQLSNDLSKQIKDKVIADDTLKDYEDTLKQYDPNFHNDDGDGKPNV